MKIEKITVGELQTNCYLIINKNKCIIIDPGAEPEKIIKRIKQLNIYPVSIINTHGHADHIGANSYLKQIFPELNICIHTLDKEKLLNPQKNLSAEMGYNIISPQPDILFNDDENFSIDIFNFKVIYTPGHSKGSICLYLKNGFEMPGTTNKNNESTNIDILFTGDTLFCGSIGRYDFPDSNEEEIRNSLKKIISIGNLETIILPGHGCESTLSEEFQNNPFIFELK